jgi:transcriptional regulator of acetoin/glycerol metabolism
VLVASDLPLEISRPDEARDGAPIVVTRPPSPDPEATRLLQALERANGNRTRAAKALGMSRVTLWRKLRELGVEDTQS